jgi:hypothetical protein
VPGGIQTHRQGEQLGETAKAAEQADAAVRGVQVERALTHLPPRYSVPQSSARHSFWPEGQRSEQDRAMRGSNKCARMNVFMLRADLGEGVVGSRQWWGEKGRLEW